MTSFKLWKQVLFSVIVAAFLTGPALAQNAPDDLRRENETLRRQVRDLQKELDDAKAQIARLERMLDRMKGESSATSSDQSNEPEVTIDESKPDASPRALFNAIVASHDEAMNDVDMDRPNSRQRTAYMRALERWVNAAQREFKLPVEWHVKMVGDLLVNRDGSAKATVVAVDPKTDAQLGDPFDIMIDSIIVRRIGPVYERGDLDKMKLGGVVVPHIRVNLERPDRGAFDSPRFIGPFAEYAMEVQVRSLTPIEKPKQSPPRREGQGTSENKDPTPNPRRSDPDK